MHVFRKSSTYRESHIHELGDIVWEIVLLALLGKGNSYDYTHVRHAEGNKKAPRFVCEMFVYIHIHNIRYWSLIAFLLYIHVHVHFTDVPL